jgi:hypothetical protein
MPSGGSMRNPVIMALFAASWAALSPRPAAACAACGCGDPTLTSMGTEKPFAGRFRVSAEFRHLTLEIGAPETGGFDLREERLTLGLAYAPIAWVFLSVEQPVVQRAATYANAASDSVTHVGDTVVRAKLFVFQDRPFDARHLLSLTAGSRLPTAPEQRASDGAPLSSELHTGAGALGAIAGLAYAAFFRPWSMYASSTATAPMVHRFDFVPGPSLDWTVGAQLQALDEVAIRLDADARWDDVERTSEGVEPDTGGFFAFLSPQVAVSPVTDFLISAGVRVPFLQRPRGTRDEGPIFFGSVVLDL